MVRRQLAQVNRLYPLGQPRLVQPADGGHRGGAQLSLSGLSADAEAKDGLSQLLRRTKDETVDPLRDLAGVGLVQDVEDRQQA